MEISESECKDFQLEVELCQRITLQGAFYIIVIDYHHVPLVWLRETSD